MTPRSGPDRPNPSRPARPRPPRQGLAAAMGAWSARHRKSAVFGWLLFVVLAAYLGGVHGSTQVTESESMPGQVARAAKILDEAGIKAPASESVLVQSAALTADDPAFRAVVDQVQAAVTGTGKTGDLRSPYDTQAFSADRHSALVQFTVTGDREKAAENIPAVLDAVAKVQAQHRDLTVEELGEASSGKWFEDQFADDFQRAEWTAVPLALGILLIAFGALVAAVLPVVLALTAFIAAAWPGRPQQRPAAHQQRRQLGDAAGRPRRRRRLLPLLPAPRTRGAGRRARRRDRAADRCRHQRPRRPGLRRHRGRRDGRRCSSPASPTSRPCRTPPSSW